MIVKPDAPDHWQTAMLREKLGDDRGTVEYLVRLWGHCERSKRNVFDNLPSVALKSLCRYPGHANLLESALVASGFLRRDDAGILTVVNWDKHNASLIASWENGRNGGRPPKKPDETHGLPEGTPSRTDKSREDQSRQDSPSGRKKPPTPLPDIPPELDTPEFREAWQRWGVFRTEIKAPLTPSMAAGQLKRLAREGVIPSIERINSRIENGWRGLWFKDENSNGTPSPNHQTTTSVRADNRRAQVRAAEFGGGDVGTVPVFRG